MRTVVPTNSSLDEVSIPGNKVGALIECIPGPGTYINGNGIYASLSGFLKTDYSIAAGETLDRSFVSGFQTSILDGHRIKINWL